MDPDQNARMAAYPTDLISKCCRCHCVLLSPPLFPFLPRVAAHPSRHHEEAEAIGTLEETIVLVVAFQPHRVEMHVERVAELRVLTFRLRAEEHVRRPAATADQNAPAVDAKETSAPGRRLGSNFANAEPEMLPIRHASAAHELERQIIQRGLSQLGRPPEAWVHE